MGTIEVLGRDDKVIPEAVDGAQRPEGVKKDGNVFSEYRSISCRSLKDGDLPRGVEIDGEKSGEVD